MRTAILLTGALRTIRKTIPHFKKNVQGDVFVCVQNDSGQPESEWEDWFHQELGKSLKSIVWFKMDQFDDQREQTLSFINISQSWKNYLRRSGSIIEYYQLYLAYGKMAETNELYEWIIRMRTDSIFTKPIDFHWLRWTDEEVQTRMDRINVNHDKHLLRDMMCTLLSDDLIPRLSDCWNGMYEPESKEREKEKEITAKEMNDYLKEGKYILTMRKNHLYIVRRKYFYLIPSIGFLYGTLRTPVEDDYWFNAEGQFQAACYHSGLTQFDYCGAIEDSSLKDAANWNESDYFNEKGHPHPNMIFCVVRK